jgi:hypothetical protein
MDLTNIIKTYVDLLILQYANQPKAKATIELIAKELLADGIYWDSLEAYNIDTAIGKQLDIIGKYIGIDRFYKSAFSSKDLFAFATKNTTNYNNVVGFATKNTTNYNNVVGFATKNNYDYLKSKSFSKFELIGDLSMLSDDAFRLALYFKRMQNNANASYQSISENLYKIFGNDIVAQTNRTMDIYYYANKSYTSILAYLVQKKALPKPMGVRMAAIIVFDKPFFSFATKNTVNYSKVVGFATKNNKVNAEFMSHYNLISI